MTYQSGLQLRSLVKSSGELELSLVTVPTPEPKDGEIVVKIEAAPINPSDLGLLIGVADMSTSVASGTADMPVVTAKIPEKFMRAVAGRLDESMPVGNEGCGTVVAAGAGAEGLMGKRVAVLGGATYSQYRTVRAMDAMPLPEGTSAADGASCFVNPLTSLSMTEVMRREGHKALIHTAAASNLGQMLNRICIADGIPLVNIVRNQAQADLLRGIGATYVVDSTSPDFMVELTKALVETGATIAFDAIGGGKLASQILTAMEAAINQTATEYSRYGSAVHKQVYIYGGLDMAPTELNRSFGLSWGVCGWLLTPFLQKIGREDAAKLRARVADELTTTFKSHYTREISLAEALDVDVIAQYNKRATGEKYLIVPWG